MHRLLSACCYSAAQFNSLQNMLANSIFYLSLYPGLKIQKIENLILTKDQNEAIDFTDNDIVRFNCRDGNADL